MAPHEPLIRIFTGDNWAQPPLHKGTHTYASYPEGNFGGNQLLDGSISLSPLNPDPTNELHVSIAASLHQSFPWLRPVQA